MKQEFEAKYGITVNYVRMSSGEALARVQAEKDNPQFDIWWGGPIDSFVAAKGEGLLEPYDSPNYGNLTDPAKMKDVDNQWVGVYVGTLGFATNTDWLAANPDAKAPTSWDDLLKPEFKGQVMVAHPSSSGTSYTALATILQLREGVDEPITGVVRTTEGQISKNITVQDKSKVFNTDLIETIELGNLIDICESINEGALNRQESRGAHTREDFPKRNDTEWMKHTSITKNDTGDPKIDYKPVIKTRFEPMERKY